MCTAYLADMYRIDFVTLRGGLFTTFARLSITKLLGGQSENSRTSCRPELVEGPAEGVRGRSILALTLSLREREIPPSSQLSKSEPLMLPPAYKAREAGESPASRLRTCLR